MVLSPAPIPAASMSLFTLEGITIVPSATDFNMKAVHDAERKVVDTVKKIKGELPLFGLTERINYSFLLMNPVGHLPKNDFGKVLEKK